jgi:hypothetical protein
MLNPVSARIPEADEECAANFGTRELAGIMASAMLAPGEADVVPVELTYDDGQRDVVLLISGGGYTAMACVLFGPEGETHSQFHTWAQAVTPLVQAAIDAYDVEPEAPAPTADDINNAYEATRIVDEPRR